MTKILFIRHAESLANVGDLAFGNLDSPLTEKAIQVQIPQAKKELIEKYNINPENYELPVASSLYLRTYQTAVELGFKRIDKLEILGEVDISRSISLSGLDIVKKHVQEHGWLPNEEISQAKHIIESIRSGKLNYRIMITHGVIIAGIIDELNKSGSRQVEFDSSRGNIPRQAQIVELDI